MDPTALELLAKLFGGRNVGEPLRHCYLITSGDVCSYLVGTLHATPVSHKQSLRSLLQKTNNLFLEVSPKELEQRDQLLLDFVTRTTSTDELSEEEQRICRKLWARHRSLRDYSGLGLSPWMLRLLIIRNIYERKMWRPIEAEACEVAEELGLRVNGLETLSEQYEAMAMVERSAIFESLKCIDSFEESYRVTMDKYYHGNLSDIEGLLNSENPHYVVARRQVEIRNERLLHRMMSFLREGHVAVFLGIAHCPSLLRNLRELGFGIETDPFDHREPSGTISYQDENV